MEIGYVRVEEILVDDFQAYGDHATAFAAVPDRAGQEVAAVFDL